MYKNLFTIFLQLVYIQNTGKITQTYHCLTSQIKKKKNTFYVDRFVQQYARAHIISYPFYILLGIYLTLNRPLVVVIQARTYRIQIRKPIIEVAKWFKHKYISLYIYTITSKNVYFKIFKIYKQLLSSISPKIIINKTNMYIILYIFSY